MPPKGKGRGKAAASNHQLASKIPVGETFTDLRKKVWYNGPVIGSGGFGLIYLADENESSVSSTKAKNVIKVEPHGNGPLYCEIAFYQRAAKSDMIENFRKENRLSYVGIPPYVAHGLLSRGKEDLRFLVMPRFGSDLHSLWLKCGKKFPRKTVCQVAIELITALEYMHCNEYVHADVKGANILVGHKNPNQIYLVDFGLAYRYVVDGTQKEYKEDPRKAHDGTIEYTSRDAHLGVYPSRRSDMEILGYVLLHWLSSRLPWENKLDDKNYVKDQKIKYMKNIDELLAETYPEALNNKSSEIKKYLEYVAKLTYNEAPKYDLMRKMFKDTLKSLNIGAGAKISFDADVPSSPVKQVKTPKKVISKKPLSSATNLLRHKTSSESLEDEIVPKKRSRKARKTTNTTDEDIPSSSSDISPIKKPVAVKKKKTAVKPKRGQRKRTVESTSSEKSSLDLSKDDSNFNSSTENSDKTPGKNRKPVSKNGPVKSRARKRKSCSSGETSEEVNVVDSTIEVRKSPRTSSKEVQKKSPIHLAKSRYSMAPLHTKSVLGEGDQLTGDKKGKHPVIIRRRKTKRPKSDATTQTTPKLRKIKSFTSN